jgi:hypothetical protein
MSIGLDLTALTASPTGVDRYLLSLATALARADTTHHFAAFINREDSRHFSDLVSDRFRVYRAAARPRVARLAFQQAALPVAAVAMKLDVVHSPAFVKPMVGAGARHVVSIHDLTTITMPETHIPLRRSATFSRALRRSVRDADAVCVPSAYVQADVLRNMDGVSAGKLHVTPYGVESRFRPEAKHATRSVLTQLGISAP